VGTNMEKDKEILVNWAEMRQLRLRNVRKMAASANPNLFHLRVLYNDLDYYAQLEISGDRLIIIPDDKDIEAPNIFFDGHFRGVEPVIDEKKRIFHLQFNFKNLRRLPIIFVLRDKNTLTKLESAVSKFFDASTDYDPNEIVEEEEEEPVI
jgi:hypothetical protein